MSDGFIFGWTQTDLAGRIHITRDTTHQGKNAAFGLSSCSDRLRTFLEGHNTPPSVKVKFDLFQDDNRLLATNVDAI